MTGGMNQRGEDRMPSHRGAAMVHGNPAGLWRPPGGSNIEPWVNTARHCWVLTTRSREPGLLIEWRRNDRGTWHGLVVRQIPGGFAATWVPAAMLSPSEPQRS